MFGKLTNNINNQELLTSVASMGWHRCSQETSLRLKY